jgi:hypothetical protein
MFTATALVLVFFIVGMIASRGPRVGLWAGLSLALLMPTWVKIPVNVLSLDFVTIACLTAVAGFLTMPFSKAFGRWTLCDKLMALLIALQLATLVYQGQLKPSTLCYTLAEWLLPYIIGRLAIASRDDLDGLTKWLALPMVLITVYAAIECFLHISPINAAVGRHWLDYRRYGLSRASGPTSHPIYLGMLMTLLLPWAIWALQLARRGSAPRWFAALPVICALGTLFAMSRGPSVALFGTLSCVAFFHYHRHRVAIASGAFVLALLATVGSDMVVDGFRALERQEENQQQKMIRIDGQEVEYDGTLHRFLLFNVYDDAMWEGGLLGHGPMGSESYLSLVEGDVSQVMESIDNHYIIHTLNFGFLGIGAFVAIALCGSWYAAQESFDSSRPTHVFTAAQAGSLAMVSLLMFTVWFAPDFRCVWLFSLGTAAAWRAHGIGDSQQSLVMPEAQVRNMANRRLVPGHPLARLPAE